VKIVLKYAVYFGSRPIKPNLKCLTLVIHTYTYKSYQVPTYSQKLTLTNGHHSNHIRPRNSTADHADTTNPTRATK